LGVVANYAQGAAIFNIIIIIVAPFSNFINGFGKMQLTVNFSLVGITTFYFLSFILAKTFHNSFSIAIALSVTSLIGLVIQGLQTKKILNGTAKGVWLK